MKNYLPHNLLDDVYYKDVSGDWVKTFIISTRAKGGYLVNGYGPPLTRLDLLTEQEMVTQKKQSPGS